MSDQAAPAADAKVEVPVGTMNFWRQTALFAPGNFEREVHIVGLGATGSHLVDALANMGVQKLFVYDFDVVEDHNLPNQIFRISDVGKTKVQAMVEHCLSKCGLKVTGVEGKVSKIDGMKGVLCLCTDSMESQKQIFNSSARKNDKCELVIETRMGLEGGRIYAFDPCHPKYQERWLGNWYPDKGAQESPCNARAIATTAKCLAAMAAHRVVQRFGGGTSLVWYHETLLNLDGSAILNKWD